jgi:hypothetical protein
MANQEHSYQEKRIRCFYSGSWLLAPGSLREYYVE